METGEVNKMDKKKRLIAQIIIVGIIAAMVVTSILWAIMLSV